MKRMLTFAVAAFALPITLGLAGCGRGHCAHPPAAAPSATPAPAPSPAPTPAQPQPPPS
jgi:hypothetical protein